MKCFMRFRRSILLADGALTVVAAKVCLADGALTKVAANVRGADDLLTEKNCLNPSKPEYFPLHRNRENVRKKPRHPKMTRLS